MILEIFFQLTICWEQSLFFFGFEMERNLESWSISIECSQMEFITLVAYREAFEALINIKFSKLTKAS